MIFAIEPTCSCESSGCRKGEQKAHWLPQPGNCCPAGSQLNIWPQPADHRTLSGQSAPLSVYCTPSNHTVCGKHRERERNTCGALCRHLTDSHDVCSSGSNLMMPSSAALQKVLGHIGAVAMRFTLLVWSENIWMVSFTVTSCTWTFVSAAPVTRILSPEWGRNCMDRQKYL